MPKARTLRIKKYKRRAEGTPDMNKKMNQHGHIKCCKWVPWQHLDGSWFALYSHDILLDKLSAYGISSHSVSLLKSYLSNRKQQIKVNRVLSSWADIHKGVPQGSILGPSYLMSLLMTYFTLFLIAPCIIMQMTIPSHSVIQILMYLYLLWRLTQIN